MHSLRLVSFAMIAFAMQLGAQATKGSVDGWTLTVNTTTDSGSPQGRAGYHAHES
jgi:hypothetical protein